MAKCKYNGCKMQRTIKKYQMYGETREAKELSLCYKHLIYFRLYQQWRKKHGKVLA